MNTWLSKLLSWRKDAGNGGSNRSMQSEKMPVSTPGILTKQLSKDESAGPAALAATQAEAASEPSAPRVPRARADQAGTEWQIGSVVLDLYELKQVHEGGMGFVYRVRHRGWDVDLAVKCPQPDYFQTSAQKDLFNGECEAWTKLGQHPNIVTCYYARTLEGIPRVFAEYIEGGSLKDWIDSRKLGR